MSSNEFWSWVVPEERAGDRADRAILSALEEGLGTWSGAAGAEEDDDDERVFSRSQVQKWIDDGLVLLNGKSPRASVKLAPGDRIEARPPAPRSMTLTPEDRPLDILHEDEHLVVVNKPPGLTVHPSITQLEGTLVHALLFHIKDLSGIGGVLRPGIVHRIDKDTSGALVVTKTDAAHQKLVETFSKHAIERRYWAICYGSPRNEREKIESLIGRSPTDRKRMSMQVKEGRKAVTHLTRLESYGEPSKSAFASLVEARLETGRTHQVRVHLAGLGHSLLGDPVYGTPTERHPKWLALPADIREAVRALPGQALHARVLGFEHPITGKALRFEAAPPPALQKLLDALARYR